MKKKAITIILVIIIIILLIPLIKHNVYNKQISQLENYVALGNYISAYNKLDEITPKTPEDEKLLEKIQVLGNLLLKFEQFEKHRDSYTPDTYNALVILLDGYEYSLDYIDRAKELDMVDDFFDIKYKYVRAASDIFKLSEKEMKEIINISPDEREKIISTISEMGKEIIKEQRIKDKLKQQELEYKRNNPLEFQDIKLDREGNYIVCTGYLKNNSKLTYTFIKIKVIYYDKSNEILDTDWTYVVGSEGLAPNEKKSFKVMTDYTEGITDVTVSIIDFK